LLWQSTRLRAAPVSGARRPDRPGPAWRRPSPFAGDSPTTIDRPPRFWRCGLCCPGARIACLHGGAISSRLPAFFGLADLRDAVFFLAAMIVLLRAGNGTDSVGCFVKRSSNAARRSALAFYAHRKISGRSQGIRTPESRQQPRPAAPTATPAPHRQTQQGRPSGQPEFGLEGPQAQTRPAWRQHLGGPAAQLARAGATQRAYSDPMPVPLTPPPPLETVCKVSTNPKSGAGLGMSRPPAASLLGSTTAAGPRRRPSTGPLWEIGKSGQRPIAWRRGCTRPWLFLLSCMATRNGLLSLRFRARSK
jgi:hypothetical protein